MKDEAVGCACMGESDGVPSSFIVHRSSLAAYRDLLAEATRALNLTSVRDPAAIERRHITESLMLARVLADEGLLPQGARVIDVGSGGGLPGIPLALARPDLGVTLLEATAKKAAFLEDAVQRLGLSTVRVLGLRAEEAAHLPGERERYDLVVARAVAALAALVELTLPFARVGGALAAVKGSRMAEELAAATAAITRCGGGAARIVALPGEATHLRLVIVPKAAPTPPDLPRRPGMPVKRPLR